jgi:hypothetical protein
MKNINNTAHVVLGAIIWNFVSHITGFVDMNLTVGNIIGIATVTFVFGVVAGGGHEWLQKVIANAFFDVKDIIRTAVGFFIGLAVALLFPIFYHPLVGKIAIGIVVIYWLRLIYKRLNR